MYIFARLYGMEPNLFSVFVDDGNINTEWQIQNREAY